MQAQANPPTPLQARTAVAAAGTARVVAAIAARVVAASVAAARVVASARVVAAPVAAATGVVAAIAAAAAVVIIAAAAVACYRWRENGGSGLAGGVRGRVQKQGQALPPECSRSAAGSTCNWLPAGPQPSPITLSARPRTAVAAAVASAVAAAAAATAVAAAHAPGVARHKLAAPQRVGGRAGRGLRLGHGARDADAPPLQLAVVQAVNGGVLQAWRTVCMLDAAALGAARAP